MKSSYSNPFGDWPNNIVLYKVEAIMPSVQLDLTIHVGRYMNDWWN